MNGVELPKDHGFPIRAVVPGKSERVVWEESLEGLRLSQVQFREGGK